MKTTIELMGMIFYAYHELQEQRLKSLSKVDLAVVVDVKGYPYRLSKKHHKLRLAMPWSKSEDGYTF